MKALSKEWAESKLPNEDGQEIGAGCSASDLFGVWQPIATVPERGDILVWIDITEREWPGYTAAGEVYSHAHGLLNRESRLNPGAAPIVASWWMPSPMRPPNVRVSDSPPNH